MSALWKAATCRRTHKIAFEPVVGFSEDALRTAHTTAFARCSSPLSSAENWTQNRNKNVSLPLTYRSVF